MLSLSGGVSGMESSVPLQGRPYGGCAIFSESLHFHGVHQLQTVLCYTVIRSNWPHFTYYLCISTHWLWYFILTSFSLFLVSLKVLYTQNPLTVSWLQAISVLIVWAITPHNCLLLRRLWPDSCRPPLPLHCLHLWKPWWLCKIMDWSHSI